MNKINNPVIHLIIIGMLLLTVDSLCKNQVSDTMSGPNQAINPNGPAMPAQNYSIEDQGIKGSAAPLPHSEKEIQLHESKENEGKNIKFGIGIIL
jgi:hypothetical protein